MIRKVLAVGFILGFGALKIPWELRLDQMQRDTYLRGAKLNLELREQVGQMGFLAALGGFRSLLAAIFWIDAHNAWERTEWGRMAGLFHTVTTLQPRSLLYWDMASWHMAYNASAAVLNDPDQPSEALRIRAQRQYFDLGRDFLERGIRNNPDRPMLYERLGVLFRDKYEDPCAAAEMFAKAVELPGHPPYLPRFVAYALAECPGREKEAYEILRSLYEKGETQHLPTLIRYLKEFEEKLGIPVEDRIKEDLPSEP